MQHPRPTRALRPRRGWWRRARRAAGHEDGQALVFGALTLFMLAAFVLFISDLGVTTSARVDVQIAADECAYSGALYEANLCSSVAYLNEAMAYLYYDALRYATDTTLLGVLAQFKYVRPKPPPDELIWDDADAMASPYSGSPIPHYNRAYDRAREQVPEIERTLNMFARWEWGMALASSEVVKMEIHRTALKHAIEAVALYPDFDFFPGSGVQFDLHILRIVEGGEHVGWRVWADDPPFFVEARKLGPFHWLITNTDRTTYEVQRVGEDEYKITTPNQEITVHQLSDDHIKVHMIQQHDGTTEETKIDAQRLDGIGWAVSMEDDDVAIEYQPFRDGGYTIKVTDKQSGQVQTSGIRRHPTTGRMQEWVGGEWRDVPGQRDTVVVGGVEIGVSIDTRIHLGPDTWFRPPAELHLGNITYQIPDMFQMPNIWVTLLEDTARIDAFIDIRTPNGSRRLRFTVDESLFHELTLHGLMGHSFNVPRSADCKWHSNRDGDERDRLCRDCQLDGSECVSPPENETEWTYQYRLDRPYFVKEDLRRFAHHAICDRDPYARANDFEYPRWAHWYDIAQGTPHGGDYYQTRTYDHDGDGKPEPITMTAAMTGNLNRDGSRDFDPFYRQVKPWTNSLTKFAPPICLSEDFFFYGLTVGCWRIRDRSKTFTDGLYSNPRWGVVAAATARAGFLETTSEDDPDGGADGPHYRFTWPTAEEVELFAATGYENLYEPVWTAHLWPMTDAIRSDHIRAYVDNQTGLSYLLRGLLHAHWYTPRSPDDLGEEPRLREDVPLNFLQSLPINVDHPDIGEVIEH